MINLLKYSNASVNSIRVSLLKYLWGSKSPRYSLPIFIARSHAFGGIGCKFFCITVPFANSSSDIKASGCNETKLLLS